MLTADNYENNLEEVYKRGGQHSYQLLAVFCRENGLDFKRTQQDFRHIVTKIRYLKTLTSETTSCSTSNPSTT